MYSLPVVYLGPNYGGGNEDNGDLLQKVPSYTAALSAPTLKQPTTDPCPHSWTLLATLGQPLVWSLLLSPASWCTQVLFVPIKILFPQSCVNSGMVGLNVTSSKRAYAIPRSAAPRAPAPAAVQTLKHSSVSVSVESLGPGVQKVCLSPLSISGGYGV